MQTETEHADSPRNRGALVALGALVAAMGWSARTYASSLPFLVGTYAPDMLWATLVFVMVLLARPSLSTRRATFFALCLSYGVECSQLYQAPWLNDIRDTRAGGLLLGHGFLWSDLLCYTLGVALGALMDARFRKSATS